MRVRNNYAAARLMRQFILDQLAEHGAVNTADLLRGFIAKHRHRYKATALQSKINVMEREGVVRRESRAVVVHAYRPAAERQVFAAKYPLAMDTLRVLVKRDRPVHTHELPRAFQNVLGRARSLGAIMVDLKRLKAIELVKRPRWGYAEATAKGITWVTGNRPAAPSIFD